MSHIDSATIGRYAPPMQTDIEKILVEQAQQGNDDAFAKLIDGHSEKIIQLAWRLVGNRNEAEDICQEAFLRFYRALPKFRNESRVGTWLYRTVSRLAIDHLRREKLKRSLFIFRSHNDMDDLLDSAASADASPHEQVQGKETAKKVQQILQRLPARQKTIFVLRHHEGMTLKEIAEMLGLSDGTVKAHLHRAVCLFRRELAEMRGIDS